MSIEYEIFKRRTPDFKQLEKYGFRREDDAWRFEKSFMGGAFSAKISVGKNGVFGKVFDAETGEEYLPVHIENHVGGFVGEVKWEYERLLEDIAEKCFAKELFLNPQANRIAARIREKYSEMPDHPFGKYPSYAVFRCAKNKKWYALVMDIPKKLLDGETDEKTVEVMNIKAESGKIAELCNEKGIYPAYHMNKKSWISALLDGTLDDERIAALIDDSRNFALGAAAKTARNGKKCWLIPANPRFYDVEAAFRARDELDWKQGKGIETGDTVYMYVGAPISAVLYKCLVVEAMIPYSYNDGNVKMTHVMRIRKIKEYPKDKFTFKKLAGFGVRTVRGPRFAPEAFIEQAEKE